MILRHVYDYMHIIISISKVIHGKFVLLSENIIKTTKIAYNIVYITEVHQY